MDEIISVSLLQGIHKDAYVPPMLRIGMEELLGIDSEANPEEDMDAYLMAASQTFKRANLLDQSVDLPMDDLLLVGSQQYEAEVEKSLSYAHGSSDLAEGSRSLRFGSPKRAKDLESLRKEGTAKNTNFHGH